MEEQKLTAPKVSQHLGVNPITLSHWYKWYRDDNYEKPADMPPLPDYEQNGKTGTRYWRVADLEMIEAFKAWIPQGRLGIMGDFNAQFWGARGRRIQAEKAAKRQNKEKKV